MKERPPICRCIGVSGSCTTTVCQYELPNFSDLGKKLREIYNSHTCEVTWNGIIGERSRFTPSSSCENGYNNTDIIYIENSPSYCAKNVHYGSAGTHGRECDPHSSGPNSCNNLCTQCNRGHVQVREQLQENCFCEFVFCCEIRCHVCTKTRAYYVCT